MVIQSQLKRRDSYLRRVYGISLAKYNDILKKQGGACSVCKSPPKPERSLAVDHDHKTGEIYGLLCFLCNHVLIGKIRNPVLYTNAAKYLTKGLGLFVPPKKKKKKRRKR